MKPIKRSVSNLMYCLLLIIQGMFSDDPAERKQYRDGVAIVLCVLVFRLMVAYAASAAAGFHPMTFVIGQIIVDVIVVLWTFDY